MNRDVFWTAEARGDVSAIVRHVAQDDPDAAERVAARIFEAAALIGMGVPGRPGRMPNSFEKVVRGLPYILACDVAADGGGGERVVILHVIHGARNWLPDRWPPA